MTAGYLSSGVEGRLASGLALRRGLLACYDLVQKVQQVAAQGGALLAGEPSDSCRRDGRRHPGCRVLAADMQDVTKNLMLTLRGDEKKLL